MTGCSKMRESLFVASKLTPEGKCPVCKNKIAKVDEENPRRMFYKVRTMFIDQKNGDVICACSNCKTELVMPAVKMPRKLKKRPYAKN